MITKKDLKLAKTIKKYRKLAGLTQQELADKVGITQKYVQYLESANRTPSLKLLRKIASQFKIEASEILG
ncbi:MAG: helix-turn-helix transcriptional regulator [Microgenomates group bacterium]|jgi:transcriptional regulator with XRE-family HTH domain